MENNVIKSIRFLFSKKEEPYFSLKKILGFRPLDMSYYKLALIHKSVRVQEGGQTINNERLEYLGDSVLGTVVADILYTKYPDKREGELTNIRSRIVQRMSLDALAIAIGLDKLMQINHKCTKNFSKVHINGNAFEALMGAIYLDRGYSKCKEFIIKLIEEGTINLEQTAKRDINFKSKLIEWAQRERVLFAFTTDGEEYIKEQNLTIFHSSVYLQGIKVGEGVGSNKKESQQDAARKALKKLKNKNVREEIEAARKKDKENAEQRATQEPQPVSGIEPTKQLDDTESSISEQNNI